MEVPEMVLVEVGELIQAAVMLAPGANTSQQLPLFDQEARLSELSEAMTVMASGTEAGE